MRDAASLWCVFLPFFDTLINFTCSLQDRYDAHRWDAVACCCHSYRGIPQHAVRKYHIRCVKQAHTHTQVHFADTADECEETLARTPTRCRYQHPRRGDSRPRRPTIPPRLRLNRRKTKVQILSIVLYYRSGMC